MRANLLVPGQTIDLAKTARSPVLQAARLDDQKRLAVDWANLCRYRQANQALAADARPDVVFIGSSIVENWGEGDRTLIDGRRIIDRGIGGQTSPQTLVRFYSDVVALHPKVVHILVGTNDIAGNTGPTSDYAIENNMRAMADLAQANGIRVIFGSITPSRKIPWAPNANPSPRIMRLNTFLRGFARERGAIYADYYSALVDKEGGLRSDLGNDGVHPNTKGYAVMRPVAQGAIDEAMRR
ncbi:MAG: capsular biosynthesis protein [Oxalobacteraceae bacterium]|nr:MAG: capsular biosynthesis protein [Oxalobacteraceae bacterium]